MSEQIKLLTDFLHPAYSPRSVKSRLLHFDVLTYLHSDRRQLISLAVLHGLTTSIFLVSLAFQMLSKHSKATFWLARWDNYNSRRVLTINAFTIWLPLCSLYTIAQFACIIFRLRNLEWVPMSYAVISQSYHYTVHTPISQIDWCSVYFP